MTGIGRVFLVAALAWVAIDGFLVAGWLIWTDLRNREPDWQPPDRGGHVRVLR